MYASILETRITAQNVFLGFFLVNQNNCTKYIFFNLRKIDNRNKWKNYVIVKRVKLRVKLDVLVVGT